MSRVCLEEPREGPIPEEQRMPREQPKSGQPLMSKEQLFL